MAAEVKKEIQLEIAHVLFTDIVGYSKLPIHQQRALVECLNEIVRGTDEFQTAETTGRLIKIESSLGNGDKMYRRVCICFACVCGTWSCLSATDSQGEQSSLLTHIPAGC